MGGRAFQTIEGAPMSVNHVKSLGGSQHTRVYLDDVTFEDATHGSHLRIDQPTGGAVAVVRDEANKIYLHEVFRYASNCFSWEFIRGRAEVSESAEEAALRERMEEARVRVRLLGEPTVLGYVRPDTSLLTCRIPSVLFRVATTQEEALRHSGEIPRQHRWISIREADHLVGDGAVECGFTLSALALLRARQSPQD